jgi:hypothetical protein
MQHGDSKFVAQGGIGCNMHNATIFGCLIRQAEGRISPAKFEAGLGLPQACGIMPECGCFKPNNFMQHGNG